MNSYEHEVAILGGGLAGLAASYETKAPVFEAAPRVGGVASSDEVEGFIFDRGIHVLNTKSPKVLEFLASLGLDMVRVDREAHIYSHGCYSAYPFQVNSVGLPIGLRLRCVRDFLRRDRYPEPSNYQEWMYRNIGAGFAETFLIPYSQKFWGVSPREMTFEWTGNKVPKPSAWQVVRGAFWNRQTAVGSNAVFHYPANGPGYGTIANALASRGGEIRLEHRAVSLDAAGRELHFANGARLVFGTLISTIPLPVLVSLSGDAPSEVREAASRLRTNSILVVNLGIARPDVTTRHWVHFPGPDISFFRISFPHNFNRALAPAGTSSVSAEVSYDRSSPPDREAICERVIEDLRRVGVLRRDDRVIVRHTFDIPYGYCIYDRERKQAVRTIRAWLEAHDIVACGRYGLWTYFWSDEAINSGRRAAQRVLKARAGESSEAA